MAVDVEEKFDNAFGMVINIVAEDALFELRDNSTKGSYSYMINADTVALEATAGEAIDSSETTITVSDTSEMFAGMRIKIDSEEMSILDVTDATTIEVLRAANATTAATHSDGVAISDAAPELHEYVLATSAKTQLKKNIYNVSLHVQD